MIARGVMLGPDQPVILHLLGTEPSVRALEAVKMELLDAAFPLLKGSLLSHVTNLAMIPISYFDFQALMLLFWTFLEQTLLPRRMLLKLSWVSILLLCLPGFPRRKARRGKTTCQET